MTENLANSKKRSSQVLAVLVVKDNDGNVLQISDKNIEVISVEKKFTLSLYKTLRDTPGAVVVMI